MDILQENTLRIVAIFIRIDSATVFTAEFELPDSEHVVKTTNTWIITLYSKSTDAILTLTIGLAKKDGPSIALYGSLPQYHLEEE